ncbi:MAG: ATPase [Faecalibacterium sp.]|nr:ATPase [Ruminococcus sp.]MCM1392626.1 ATPase [Ruminococcus sp.]MCM1486067.1 ATPase [Faecalibacterium sp.]
MAIEKMKLVRISGSSSKLDKVISACCQLGTFQPENAADYISASMGYTTVNQESPYTKILQSINELTDTYGFKLEEHGKSKKTVIDDKTFEYIDSVGKRLQKLNDQSKELLDQLAQCNAAIEKYSHFAGLDIDLEEIFECEFIETRFGRLSKDGYNKLIKGYGDNPYILFCQCSGDADGYWGAYFAPTSHVDEVDRIFAALQFERLYVPGAAGTTDEIITHLNENIEIIQTQKEEFDKEIGEIWEKEGDKVKSLYWKLLDLEQVFEFRKYAVYHGDSCFLVGWIPAKDEQKFKEKFEKFSDFVVEIEEPNKKSKNTPPTKLKNWRIVRPYSYFVDMYGLPSYYDLDITAFVAFTYTLLFGIMFGDLGQGIVIAIVGLLAWKIKKMPLGKILVPCGISSAFFGLIFGSVFGFEEALDPLYEKLGMSGKPLSVMDSINTVLLFAIGIGVVLVTVAMAVNVVGCIKKKKYGTAIFSENGITGILVYLNGANLIYAFMAHKGIIPTGISAVILIVGMLILFNKEILAEMVDEKKLKKPESISDYLMQNLFECLEYVLSYFSNTLSFLRVGAFVIVHASMMMVVFTLAGDPNTVKGLIVIEIGNIVVIALEGLLTGIQSLRLEFYEMFSRFYEGNGRPFKAIKFPSSEK